MSLLVNEVNDTSFEMEVLKSSEPVLVDFWAAWCGPCRMLAPTVETLAEKYQGKVKVLKMNVDESPKSPSRYSVRGIPTLILFRDGVEVERVVGVPANPKEYISEVLDKHLLSVQPDAQREEVA